MPKIKIRTFTIILLLVAIVALVAGVLYFTETAAHLPSFMPGHATHSAKHHLKHGLAAITLAIVALAGAWLTTAPDRPTSPGPS